tara:strand:- start:1199 stop:1825 length:627 start_codon:yes stop_codon:yes gene_type:complete
MMREQKGIFIPEQDKAKFWSADFEIREYNKIKPTGYRAVDIGAHVGIWTRRLAVNFCRVIAFEPLGKHIECHIKNCEGLEHIELKQVALSNHNGFKLMTTKDNNSGMSRLGKANFREKIRSHQMVETRTLDSYHLPKVDFIKMDVEGWENKVLEGATETILKYRPRMYIEIFPDKYQQVYDILRDDFEYTLQKVGKANYICEPGARIE